MDDRTLLELAAKAAGIKIDKSETNGGGRGNTGFDVMGNAVLDWHNGTRWNPLTDDGDALRLAVKLDISVLRYETMTTARMLLGDFVCDERDDGDPCAATRRAIVRAAAYPGPNKKDL
jgi:hypothetical protein